MTDSYSAQVSLRLSVSPSLCLTGMVVLIMLGATIPTSAEPADWQDWLTTPDPAYTQMPFWFWNDELDDTEIKRQMADFRAHGVYGFVIHPRIGVPKSIPYLGERWLGHVRTAVEEAARTGMRVCLYDEAMYPSGSAHGEVVKANPAFAAQGIAVESRDVSGPVETEVPVSTRGRHIATLLARCVDEKRLDPATFQRVDFSDGHTAVPEGDWRLMTFVQVPSGGHIRGIHEDEEGGMPNAPAAADLLNPAAMQAFIRLGYEPYYAALKEHYGKTIIGMFTDEPSMLGRGPHRGLQPWTEGLADYFQKRRGYDLIPKLPALFFEAGAASARVRADYNLTLAERLEETYYQPLSKWCAARDIALTGHPSGSDEIRPLRYFQIPGQDMVWRWVAPNSPTALEGANSTVAKCSSSVARHDRRPRNSNEIYGAYGWGLTMDEMKWLADWLMVRGVDLLFPHAFYYSVRDYRAMERPPDLGMHNTWWPHYRQFADYTSRVCRLVSEGQQVCDVAVLSVNNTLPWRAAKWLYQNQIDFNYLEDWRLAEQARVDGRRVRVGDMEYGCLVIDQDEPLAGTLAARVQAFESTGGSVRYWRGESSAVPLDESHRNVICTPPSADLRCRQVARGPQSFYLLANEGEAAIETTLKCKARGAAEWFDAWTGEFEPARITGAGADHMEIQLHLPRRESRVLCIDSGKPPAQPRERASLVKAKTITLEGPWTVHQSDGGVVANQLGDWLSMPAVADYAGMLQYRTRFRLFKQPEHVYRLDLGTMHDWAAMTLNGEDLGPRFWSPFVWDITPALREGENELVINVTNSLINRYVPAKRRTSGLIGPVVISVEAGSVEQ